MSWTLELVFRASLIITLTHTQAARAAPPLLEMMVVFQADRSLQVEGDPELLRSSFENVIRNAVRYSPAAAHVGITARRLAGGGDYEGAVEIIIYDQGPGVPEKDLELIFEAFYRVDAARDRAVGGVGLGLAIAARAVALHGGAIEARNLQAGGLVVTITLPPLGRGTSGHSIPWGRVARASRRSSGFPKSQAGEAKEQCARHPALPSSSHVEETATRGVIAAVAKTAPIAVEDL
jgi:K+-sensing histidine kinase KdpD